MRSDEGPAVAFSFSLEGSARVDRHHANKRGEHHHLQSTTIQPRPTVPVMDQIERIAAASAQ
jgi:hypothetical protein